MENKNHKWNKNECINCGLKKTNSWNIHKYVSKDGQFYQYVPVCSEPEIETYEFTNKYGSVRQIESYKRHVFQTHITCVKTGSVYYFSDYLTVSKVNP